MLHDGSPFVDGGSCFAPRRSESKADARSVRLNLNGSGSYSENFLELELEPGPESGAVQVRAQGWAIHSSTLRKKDSSRVSTSPAHEVPHKQGRALDTASYWRQRRTS